MKIVNIEKAKTLNGFIVSFEEFTTPSWFKKWFHGMKPEKKRYRLFTHSGIIWWTMPSFNQCRDDRYKKETMFNSFRLRQAYEKNLIG